MTTLTSDQVRLLRRHTGLSLRELARRLRVDYTTIARWESGIHAISDKAALQLAVMASLALRQAACVHCLGSGVEPPPRTPRKGGWSPPTSSTTKEGSCPMTT